MNKNRFSEWFSNTRAFNAIGGPCFNLLEKFLGYPILKIRFKRRTGYKLNLKDPTSFNEKINLKKVKDRNPLLTVVADKHRVRGYIADIIGQEKADEICIPHLHVTDDPRTIPFDELPDEYVIKTNHRSGANLIVEKDHFVDRRAIIRNFTNQLKIPYARFKHEWGYLNIPRKVLIEPLIRDEEGRLPVDYKLHMISGRCVMIHVHHGLCDDWDNQTCTVFDRDWVRQDVFWNHPPRDHVPRPDGLDEMIAIAEALARPLDMVRVDFFSMNGRLYFGEMTNYPYSGFSKVSPRDYELYIGSLWNQHAEGYSDNPSACMSEMDGVNGRTS